MCILRCVVLAHMQWFSFLSKDEDITNVESRIV